MTYFSQIPTAIQLIRFNILNSIDAFLNKESYGSIKTKDFSPNTGLHVWMAVFRDEILIDAGRRCELNLKACSAWRDNPMMALSTLLMVYCILPQASLLNLRSRFKIELETS